MSIVKHVTLQKIVAHDFRYDPRTYVVYLVYSWLDSSFDPRLLHEVPRSHSFRHNTLSMTPLDECSSCHYGLLQRTTLAICNTYCFSATTMVARIRPTTTLYVYCLSCPFRLHNMERTKCLMGDALEINGAQALSCFVIKYLLCVSNRNGPGICPMGGAVYNVTDGSNTIQHPRFILAAFWRIYKAGIASFDVKIMG